jgi:hypothetical protein
MSDPVSDFMALHNKLLAAGLENEEADAIRDQMDRPWYALTDEQRDEVRRRIAMPPASSPSGE